MLPYLDKGQKIPMYGVMMFLGITACFCLILFFVKCDRIKREDKIYGGTIATVGGLVGAKVLFIITSIPLLIDNELSLLEAINSGFVFYGGLIGGFVALTIYCKLCNIKLFDFYDLCALVLPIGQAFGRVGCFLAGCCYGKPTSSFLGVHYHTSLDINTPLGIKILPTQLFESAYCIIIFALLFILYRKNISSGLITAVYMISYSVCRFVNEFFRDDDIRGFLFGLSTSQIISIFVLIGGVVLFLTVSLRGKIDKANANTSAT